MKQIAGYASALLSMVLVACTTVDATFQHAAPPPPGKALVYVYRLDTWPVVRGGALFSIGDTNVAALSANSYTWFYVPEGDYRLEQKWDIRHVQRVTHRDFSARAGSAHYLRLNVEGEVRQMKWWLSDVPAPSAIDEISKCRFEASKDAAPKLSPGVSRSPDTTDWTLQGGKQQ